MIWARPRPLNTRLPDAALEGFRLILRPPVLSDYDQWRAVRGRNREFLQPYEPTWPDDCLSQEFFKRRLAQQAQDWRQGRACPFLVFKREGARLIGGANINNIARGAAQHATLGYWLDEQEQGQGYMAEALRLVIDYGFTALRLHRFNAGCLAGNERSAKLLLKLGFEEEGFARKYVRIDGEWRDHRLFGLPAEHWPSSASGSRPT